MKIFILGIFISTFSFAQNTERGKNLYSKCIQCHGDKGQGNKEMSAPRIGGQYDWYIYSSLVDFKSGARENVEMQPYIKNLGEKDFKDLAAYIATIK